MLTSSFNCIVVLGPTASGKTKLACKLAYEFNGEIISADSRQVYKHLNIGTGKDLDEYTINGKHIPYHLIDIIEPEQQFYLHDFIRECRIAFERIVSKKKIPVICGGTGLYLDSLHKDFRFTQIPEDLVFREQAGLQSIEELLELLRQIPEKFRAHADLNSHKRIIRAIEVGRYLQEKGNQLAEEKSIYKPLYIGIEVSKEERFKLISSRLEQRLENGLIEEAEFLLARGITHDRLRYFGLEYKYLSYYLKGEISRDELKSQLTTAILQFSKRQMTWFRKMEKEGIKIHWLTKNSDPSELISKFKHEA